MRCSLLITLILADFNVGSFKGLQDIEDGKLNKGTQTPFSIGAKRGESMEMGSFYSSLGLEDKENRAGEGLHLSKHHHDQDLQQFLDFECLHDLHLDVVSPQFQLCSEPDSSENIVEPSSKERPYAASLEILSSYGSRIRRLNGEKIKVPWFNIKSTEIIKQKLTTIAILRLAGEKFIHSSNPTNKNEPSSVGLSEDDNQDVELVLHLLSAADKLGKKQSHQAKKLLKKCKKLSFDKGNPIQRLVHHFSEALRQRIDREAGRCTSNDSGGASSHYAENVLSTINSAVFAFQKAAPFYYVSQFAGMQVIIEQVEGARKVHIIDLQIRLGMQYTILIQALAARSECPVELLKITAVATNRKATIEATGRRLKSFSESFNLPFSFRVVMVEDMLDLHESLFEIDDDEALAVYSEFFLKYMLERPDRLESLMGAIRTINPCVMVVTEVEANHNSPAFVNRFTEALFYYGAFFDAFEDCLKDDGANRIVMETMFSQGIKNVLATEDVERTIRHVKINVWRTFFARFGMVEVDFSMSSTYQANLLLKKFSCGSSCTIEIDGKCLIFGWKGTPIKSLSAWIFG